MWSVENSRTKSHNGAHGSNDCETYCGLCTDRFIACESVGRMIQRSAGPYLEVAIWHTHRGSRLETIVLRMATRGTHFEQVFSRATRAHFRL